MILLSGGPTLCLAITKSTPTDTSGYHNQLNGWFRHQGKS